MTNGDRSGGRSTAANVVWELCGRHVAEDRGDHVAICDEHRRWTYAELWAHVGAAARLVRSRGVRAEDRVVIVLSDSVRAVTATFGTMASGAVAVLLGSRLTRDEYLTMIGDARPRLVIVDSSHAELEQDLRKGSNAPEILVIDEATPFDGWDGERGAPEVAAVSPDEPAVIQFTSGSTGAPKGVVHLHGALTRAHHGFGSRLQLAPTDRCFSTAKLSYGFGFGNSVLFPFSAGASAVLHSGPMDPRTAIATVKRFAPTVFFAVPTLYAAILDAGTDLSSAFESVRLCVSAGEHLSEQLAVQWKRQTGTEIVDGLGCTESLHIFLSGEPGNIVPGCTGIPVPGVEVRLVDDNGVPVEPGQLGNVLVKSPWNAARYWNRQELTRHTMEGHWIRTGDIMSQDEGGRYFHFGRSDDVMKIQGLKVAPAEVEAVLVSHPAVAEAAVVQADDERAIARIVAFVRLADGVERVTESTLRAFARGHLAAHKVPSAVAFLSELPHTSTGKLARHVLREDIDMPVTALGSNR